MMSKTLFNKSKHLFLSHKYIYCNLAIFIFCMCVIHLQIFLSIQLNKLTFIAFIYSIFIAFIFNKTRLMYSLIHPTNICVFFFCISIHRVNTANMSGTYLILISISISAFFGTVFAER